MTRPTWIEVGEALLGEGQRTPPTSGRSDTFEAAGQDLLGQDARRS